MPQKLFNKKLAQLRPYQRDAQRAILQSVAADRGLTFTVEIARQGGKNELSARLQHLLLIHNAAQTVNIVKCSPTFHPQAMISIGRLKATLDGVGYAGLWASEYGYMIRLGNARTVFLSADRTSRVVGHTAHLLLEIDEAQDVSKEKYSRDFKPMGATTNATTVLYGTAWDSTTLLEETKQTNLELERKDGIRRHFQYDWQEVAKYNPDYLNYVENERRRLGENHPLFLTQYCLLPIKGGDGFLSAAQRAQLQGEHPHHLHPQPGKMYIAGIDLAGEAEQVEDELLTNFRPKQDSTLVTIGEMTESEPPYSFNHSLPQAARGLTGLEPRRFTSKGEEIIRNGATNHDCHPEGAQRLKDIGEARRPQSAPIPFADAQGDRQELSGISTSKYQPHVRVVAHYRWTGVRHTDLYPQLVDLLKNVWHCRRVVVDATGIGQPVASFLRQSIGHAVVPFTFTAASKSGLGFNLLAAINSGHLKMYAGDGSAEYREFWHEMELARSYYRPSQTMNFYVDPAQGHDDYLTSLALLVEAGRLGKPRIAYGTRREFNI
jgi:hypothetical protein